MREGGKDDHQLWFRIIFVTSVSLYILVIFFFRAATIFCLWPSVFRIRIFNGSGTSYFVCLNFCTKGVRVLRERFLVPTNDDSGSLRVDDFCVTRPCVARVQVPFFFEYSEDRRGLPVFKGFLAFVFDQRDEVAVTKIPIRIHYRCVTSVIYYRLNRMSVFCNSTTIRNEFRARNKENSMYLRIVSRCVSSTT